MLPVQALEPAQADGSYPSAAPLPGSRPSTDLICDDWLRDPLSRSQAKDLLAIVDGRYARASTLVTTQIPSAIGMPVSLGADPTLADSVFDRLIHDVYRNELKGDSMQKDPFPPESQGQLTL